MAHGPSDDELFDASQAMQDAFWAMAEATGSEDAVGVAVNARLDHLNTIVSLDPVRIAEEFDRMRTVASRLAHSEGAKAELAMAESRLDGWRGNAKAALVGKIANVTSHLDRMAQDANHIQHMVGSFYAVAVFARDSHLRLCREFEAAASREIGNQEKRDAKLAVAITSKVLGALASFEPQQKARSALAAFLELTEVTVGYFIDGNDAADTANNYMIAASETTRAFESGMGNLHTDLLALEAELAKDMLRSDVYAPIHPHADITSPDFRYENFAHGDGLPAAGFDDAVGQERKRMTDERRARENEIDRRLGGAE
jgi:hypothetical protein